MGGEKLTMKIQTVDEIIVRERFGEITEFKKIYNQARWKCSIRRGKKNSNLRLLNVPEVLTNEEILEAVRQFVRPLSGVDEEVFGSQTDPRLVSIINGNKSVLIEPLGPIPEFVVVASRKIRCIHKDQPKRCFRCKQEGHLKQN